MTGVLRQPHRPSSGPRPGNLGHHNNPLTIRSAPRKPSWHAQRAIRQIGKPYVPACKCVCGEGRHRRNSPRCIVGGASMCSGFLPNSYLCDQSHRARSCGVIAAAPLSTAELSHVLSRLSSGVVEGMSRSGESVLDGRLLFRRHACF